MSEILVSYLTVSAVLQSDLPHAVLGTVLNLPLLESYLNCCKTEYAAKLFFPFFLLFIHHRIAQKTCSPLSVKVT